MYRMTAITQHYPRPNSSEDSSAPVVHVLQVVEATPARPRESARSGSQPPPTPESARAGTQPTDHLGSDQLLASAMDRKGPDHIITIMRPDQVAAELGSSLSRR
jgi:hypothetical protein